MPAGVVLFDEQLAAGVQTTVGRQMRIDSNGYEFALQVSHSGLDSAIASIRYSRDGVNWNDLTTGALDLTSVLSESTPKTNIAKFRFSDVGFLRVVVTNGGVMGGRLTILMNFARPPREGESRQ